MMEINTDININLIGELRFMKNLKIKPNFSELSRKYNLDRHTIKKYYDQDGIGSITAGTFDPDNSDFYLIAEKVKTSIIGTVKIPVIIITDLTVNRKKSCRELFDNFIVSFLINIIFFIAFIFKL